MSNKKRVAKKKPVRNQKRIRTGHITTAVLKALRSIYMIYTSVSTKIDKVGYNVLPGLLKDTPPDRHGNGARLDLTVGISSLEDTLVNERRTWYYWAIVFTKEGSESMIGSIDDSVSADLTAMMPSIVNEVSPDIEAEDILGWAWMISPTDAVKFEASDDNLVDWLLNDYDILNQDKREKARFINATTNVSNINSNLENSRCGAYVDMVPKTIDYINERRAIRDLSRMEPMGLNAIIPTNYGELSSMELDYLRLAARSLSEPESNMKVNDGEFDGDHLTRTLLGEKNTPYMEALALDLSGDTIVYNPAD